MGLAGSAAVAVEVDGTDEATEYHDDYWTYCNDIWHHKMMPNVFGDPLILSFRLKMAPLPTL